MLLVATALDARTVYRCSRGASVSLSTAAEPGSKCKSFEIADGKAMPYRLWGVTRGTLYRRSQDGRSVYGTRKLPGSVAVQKFDLRAAGRRSSGSRGVMGPPRLDVYRKQFSAAAAATGTDEAWLRAIAHVESGFNARAVSPKGAKGVMQLMPATARHYDVSNPFDPNQSINAGARLLRTLWNTYKGDRIRVAAAYNAGSGAVDRYGGVPPYAETRHYVDKVLRAYARYLAAMDRAVAKNK
jgi:hypothetical protein